MNNITTFNTSNKIVINIGNLEHIVKNQMFFMICSKLCEIISRKLWVGNSDSSEIVTVVLHSEE